MRAAGTIIRDDHLVVIGSQSVHGTFDDDDLPSEAMFSMEADLLPNDDPETKWCKDLGTMCQVALAGYAVGGAFLTLAYFDLPYNIMLVVVLTRAWVEKKGWKSEPIETPRWKMALGLSPTPKLN